MRYALLVCTDENAMAAARPEEDGQDWTWPPPQIGRTRPALRLLGALLPEWRMLLLLRRRSRGVQEGPQ